MNKEVCKEVRDDWRKQAQSSLDSSPDEYCPKAEFFALLDYIDELEKEIALIDKKQDDFNEKNR